ncbi:hypothetical protein GGX14DRAFT_368115 [Mycena pura]|uniref:Uncharacterized protein n=1 Tax=Mycena pura TaxID=153505 RepID=A0AAD6YE95_9AGAR|nr:hypothetical protein GGX14DRAFT_368115 [Mycena pura]
MRAAVDSLSSTSVSYLSTSSPLKSTSAPPAFKPYTISPVRNQSRYLHLLDGAPRTAREAAFMQALDESEARDNSHKRAMVEMQASTMLADMYSKRAQSQLQGAEERKRRKTGNRKMGDGKAKYFSGDDFYKLCVEDEQRKEEEVAAKERRQADKEVHAGRIAAWQEANEAIRTRNAARREEYATDIATWEVEKTAAKAEKRRPGWLRPKLADYELEVLLPRPKKAVDENEDEERATSGSEMDED